MQNESVLFMLNSVKQLPHLILITHRYFHSIVSVEKSIFFHFTLSDYLSIYQLDSELTPESLFLYFVLIVLQI